MKKRLFSLILAISILASMVVVPAYAEEAEQNVTPITDLCPCGCGEKLQDVQWKAWAEVPNAGHYYLEDDYVQTAMVTVLSDTPVVLDLRGHTITTAISERLFTVNGYLHVMDTVGGGRMMAKGVTDGRGGVVQVEENEMVGPVFTLYSGTIMPDPKANTVGMGGLICVGIGSTFRMYGGVLQNGYAKTSYGGGAVAGRVKDSTIEILGGKIIDCGTSGSGGSIYSNGTVRVENATILGGEAATYGGNIHVTGEDASLTVKNAVIGNGISKKVVTAANKYGGGNISVYAGATANISDSEIYGGYAESVGGNLGLGRGNITITNCDVYGGTAGMYGGNVYTNLSTSNVTFDGGSIDGHFYHAGSKLTLKGALKVSANGMGLQFVSGTVTSSGLTSGAEIYVSGSKTLSGSASYYKAADRATLNGLTVSMGATGYCSQCGENVTWAAYGTAGATHVYLTENLTDFAEVNVTGELAIDLCGFSITATGRAFNVAEGGKLQIIDSVGTGAVSGKGAAGEQGGVIKNADTVNLQGGKYTYTAGNAVTDGGIIYSSGAVKLSGVTLDATAYNNAAANGGAICLAPAATATLNYTGGYVLGGTANYGGGIFCDYKTTSNITGIRMVDGTAIDGGNLGVYSTTSTTSKSINLTLKGCYFVDGKAANPNGDEFGGNMYLGRCVATLTDCVILNGESEKYGGNLNISNGTAVTMENCFVQGGTAYNGGNFYLPGNSSNLTLKNTTVTEGTSGSNGGNLTINNGYCNIYGGEISHGNAVSGGNIFSGTDDGAGLVIAALDGVKPVICNGTATSYGGNVYAKTIATINDALIHSGAAATAGNDLYVASGSTNLVLGEGVTGTIHMNAASGLLTKGVFGGAISGITCKAAGATFLMDAQYGDCGITVQDNTMYVATTAVVDGKGNTVWYSSNEAAVAACENNQYVKLFTNNDLVLTKDLYVDFNGQTVAVSGDYKVYGMDASGDDYSQPKGLATGTSAQTYDITEAPNGNTYMAIADENGVTYHRLFMKITGVNIRPSASGMYYTAKWYCDETLKSLIASYGVVASTANMPGKDFASEDENLYTAFSADSFVSGEAKNGAVITGIMSESADDNDTRGKTSVYAKAYVTFSDGTTLVSGDNISYSLTM